MSRRVLLVALFASAALNLFIGGAVVGGLVIAARSHGNVADAGAQNARPGPALWAAAESLSPERRREFRHMMREQGPVTAQSLRAARQARREAWGQLDKEPFDEAAATRSLDRARALEMTARRDVEHRIVTFAGRLPPEERSQFATGLARPEPARQERRRRMEQPRD